jgi:hypothetical protein
MRTLLSQRSTLSLAVMVFYRSEIHNEWRTVLAWRTRSDSRLSAKYLRCGIHALAESIRKVLQARAPHLRMSDLPSFCYHESAS